MRLVVTLVIDDPNLTEEIAKDLIDNLDNDAVDAYIDETMRKDDSDWYVTNAEFDPFDCTEGE